MKDYFVCKRNYKGAVNSALLAKSLDQKLWDDSPYLLKQLPGIGMVTAKVIFMVFFMLLLQIIIASTHGLSFNCMLFLF